MVEILAKILNKYPLEEAETIQKAFDFSQNAHSGQKRHSGEDYIIHPLKVAQILADFNLDYETIAAALLHDTLEETKIKSEDIEKEFGPGIAFLVQSVTKLHRVSYSGEKQYLENFNKMIFATAKDIRVVLIKLADRLHNMETLEYFTGDKEKTALETLEIYAPLASRLGMGEMKALLEDLAFPYVHPKEYLNVIKITQEQIKENKIYLEKIKPQVERILKENRITVIAVSARAKHLYSLWKKLQKYELNLERVYDLVALRIIVPDISACYEALGIVHKYWQPLPGRIKDYIALAKPNGYQSLHTTIFCDEGKITEFQIRTPEMHRNAELGVAAHWAYKERKNPVSKRLAWINQLKEWQEQIISSKEFWENVKIDFFKDRIFVFTPKGDAIDLPENATPIDFAYALHSDIGDHCEQAKTNGKIIPLNHPLEDGDTVEIIVNKKKKPSRDWLKIVKTSKARSKIKERLKLTA